MVGGREAGDRASAGLTRIDPISGRTGAGGLRVAFTSGFLVVKFSAVSAGGGLLTRDSGSVGPSALALALTLVTGGVTLTLLEVEVEVLEGEREEGLLTKASGSEDCLVGASLSWGM